MTEELKNILIRELKETVSTEIQKTVNGKIDKLTALGGTMKTQLDGQDKMLVQHGEILGTHTQTLKSLDERIKPFEETVGWVANFKKGVVWLAGLIIPMGVVIGVGKFIINLLKQ